MYASKIFINNFKTFQNTTIHFNSDINVFTGSNNAGKTTILEAIALWSECFRKLIVKARKADSKINIRQGDYRLGKKNQNYIDYRNITSVRTTRYEDIFYNMDISNDILIGVTLELDNSAGSLHIPIRIKSANGGNYLIYLDDHDQFNFSLFQTLGLPNPFAAIYASPVAALVSDENFFTKPQIDQNVLSRRSFVVLRNRLCTLKNNNLNYHQFESDISYILYENQRSVAFIISGDISVDIKVNVSIQLDGNSTPKDISLIGSGTLQIIELMLALYEKKQDLNLIMLDEPDSHIHRDIQKRLINTLLKSCIKAQIFITTHNESLIRATAPKNIFHITNNSTETDIRPITSQSASTQRIGIQPTHKSKIIKALGNNDSLDIIDCLEAKKIVFVEGEDDAVHIKEIYESIKGRQLEDYVFWSFNGLDSFIETIGGYKRFFDIVANGHNLWSKCIAVIDADYMTDAWQEQLKNRLTNNLKLPTYIWKEYTIEASVLSDLNFFKRLIQKIILQQNNALTPQSIDDVTNAVFLSVLNDKRKMLAVDFDYKKKIAGQLLNRNRKWELIDGFKGVFPGGEHNLEINFSKYACTLCDSNHLFHLATKDDLSFMVDLICNYLGVTFNYSPMSLFRYLVQCADNPELNAGWCELVDFIEQ